MNFKPLQRKVLVKEDTKEEMSNGFYMPESLDDETYKYATVIAVGPGDYNNIGDLVEPIVKVNDRVVLLKMAGNKIKIDDEEYTVVNDTDCLGIITEGE